MTLLSLSKCQSPNNSSFQSYLHTGDHIIQNTHYRNTPTLGLDNTYVPIGCFRDKQHQNGRPLPEMVGNHRNGINWHQMSETVKKCADDTWQKQFAVFGVQFYGECWSGATGYITYDKDGFNLIGCWEGVGKTHNNYVYAFTSK